MDYDKGSLPKIGRVGDLLYWVHWNETKLPGHIMARLICRSVWSTRVSTPVPVVESYFEGVSQSAVLA